MNNQQILEKAIQKAIDNKWLNWKFVKVLDVGDKPQLYLAWNEGEYYYIADLYGILFSHDFAKALWGEKYPKIELPPQPDYIDIDEKDTYPLGALVPHWKFRLQQMVIADDPIEYLGENM